jgi:hypothetical protein
MVQSVWLKKNAVWHHVCVASCKSANVDHTWVVKGELRWYMSWRPPNHTRWRYVQTPGSVGMGHVP